MPIYEFRCKNCDNIVEIFQKTSSPTSVNCSHCGSGDMEKMISVPAVVKVADSPAAGTTCCGRTERCDTPPCSTGETCRRDKH